MIRTKTNTRRRLALHIRSRWRFEPTDSVTAGLEKCEREALVCPLPFLCDKLNLNRPSTDITILIFRRKKYWNLHIGNTDTIIISEACLLSIAVYILFNSFNCWSNFCGDGSVLHRSRSRQLHSGVAPHFVALKVSLICVLIWIGIFW